MYASKSDEFLILQFKSGNDSAFDVLLSRYQSKVFSYVMQLVKDYDLANDVFQEVFIKVVINLKKSPTTTKVSCFPGFLELHIIR